MWGKLTFGSSQTKVTGTLLEGLLWLVTLQCLPLLLLLPLFFWLPGLPVLPGCLATQTCQKDVVLLTFSVLLSVLFAMLSVGIII